MSEVFNECLYKVHICKECAVTITKDIEYEEDKSNNIEKKRKVLIVDDEFSNRHIIGKMMRNAGWETIMADNGKDGYFACLRYNPDVVITDMNMPFLTGDKMIEQIRIQKPWVKFIGITGFDTGYKIPSDVELLLKPRCLQSLVEKANALCPVTI